MAVESGRVQRKKQRTRESIARTALRLFGERGFDNVSVTEIAAAADVAEKTVYNHFPSKADLVFDEDADLLAGILAAVRGRPAGVSALAALREYLPAQADRLGQSELVERRAAFRRMVRTSPTLRAHQRAMAGRYETELARLLVEETGADELAPEPFVVAVALVGALRAGFECRGAAGGVAAAITRALEQLERGVGDYAARPSARAASARAASARAASARAPARTKDPRP